MTLGDSPTDYVAAGTRSGDFMGVPKTKASAQGENSSATPNSGSHPSSQSRSGAPVTGGTTATMTVTSPAWSGTSWTGGMAYGCTAALKTTGDGATTTVPYTSAPTTPNTKFESIKSWTISTYKCSRQTLFEKLGKSSRTVDSELEAQIESLRETQRKYANILRLSRALTSHFYHVIQTQSALGECFNDLAHKSPELQEEFLYNSEAQKSLTKNGETLIKALNFFVSSVNTLCNKTMEDTIETVNQYEIARVEFDAYRSDLEFYSSAPQTEVNLAKQRETEEAFTRQKQEFEKLRSDVQIKLKFLDENRVKVMHKQLLLFHNAISAYFSGNEKSLEATKTIFHQCKNSQLISTFMG